MRVDLPDHELRQFLGVSRRTNLSEALMDWLYRDPRFDNAREMLLGQWLVKRLVARVQAGEELSDEGG